MYRRFLKRLIDLVLAILALPFLLVVFLIVAPLIYLEDKGSFFYSTKRIGKDGKLFTMLKFRSMKVNSPDIRLSDGSTYNGENDSRVTKTGKFLRKTSIDELPQVLNILIGDMSLIGPRPDPPDWIERYPEDVKVFLRVRPGITGYNQAYFRNQADGEQKMRNDVYYAQNCSFGLDVHVFFRTVATVFLGVNTYKSLDGEQETKKEALEVHH